MRVAEAISGVEVKSRTDLATLPRDELETLAEAGRELVEIHRVLTKTGDNVVGELLRGHDTFYEWDHYPPGDVYDRETHGQFYYHAHPADQRFDLEHGHFHTFIRPKGMPPGIKPAPVPNFKPPKDPNDALSHLIAIAMTSAGLPFRLFTVNRWVTGECWYRAADVATLLDYFKVDIARPSWPANRWVSAMVRLFKPQILELLEVRDRTVEDWQRAHGDRDVFEDRELEITSYMEIDIEAQVRAVGAALLAKN